ncbi:MAG: alpha/beta fold hydrolase [Burkholderiales bacterium]|nr:alpha/beta fold hydrolase [Burkholderiales bacterium]
MSERRVELAGGVTLACSISGTGPALLLMHGAEADRRMFDGLRAQLSDTFTVIAYDQRECGETEAPPQPVGLESLAQDARDLLSALGLARAHVFGSSFGGRIAQALAHLHPACIDGLVLGSTWALPDRLDRLNPQGMAAIQRLRAQLPDSAEELVEWFLPAPYLAAHPQYRELFRNARPQSERGLRRAHAVADHPALASSAIALRTLVLAGEIDRVVPAPVTLGLAETMPDARAVLLEGVGHATVLQDPARVAREIRNFCLGARP